MTRGSASPAKQMAHSSESGSEEAAGVETSTPETFRMPTVQHWRCTRCDARHLLIYRRRNAGPCVSCGSTALEAMG